MSLRRVLCGGVLAVVFLSPAAASANTIEVDTTSDVSAADSNCTLREAVESANLGAANGSGCVDGAPEGDKIVLPTGTFTLTGAAGEDANDQGDLDVTKSLILEGAGAGGTKVDAASLDRAIDVQSDGAATSVNLTVEKLTIEHGRATGSGEAGDGGGIRMRDANGTVTIEKAAVRESHADRWGGAFSFDNSTNGQSNISIVESEFSANDADGKGGAVWFRAAGSPNGIVTRSAFVGNHSDAAGGAIYLAGFGEAVEGPGTGTPSLQVVNSTLSGNSAAGGGGGIALGAANPLILVFFSTLTGNTTSRSDGAGALQTDNDTQFVYLKGSILAGNLRNGVEVNCAEPDTAVSDGVFVTHESSYSIEGANTCDLDPAAGNDLIDTDPMLATLALNAPGTTRTHGLLAGSPAIDRVPVAGCDPVNVGSSDTPVDGVDQRGVARPAGSSCDAGAFEGTAVTGGGENGGEQPAGGGSTPPASTPSPQPPSKGPTAGNDFLRGTAGPDTLCGLAGDDTIQGLGGDDALFGDQCGLRLSVARLFLRPDDGDDDLAGGPGADVLFGTGGDDVLRGGPGADRIYGGDGDDDLRGGRGENSFRGGQGEDSISARNGRRDRIDCGSGRDRATVDAIDRIRGCELIVERLLG